MDPKFEEIKHALENYRIDDQEFERVAAEIQDGSGWSCYWLPGGGDFGEDGVIHDKNKEKIPLITTISDRAKQNIERNVTKLQNSGWKGKQVAFATSQSLSGIKRKNINDYLKSVGVRSVGLFDSSWYAERLLKYPHFCKSLLNITLDYPSLSPLPANPRFNSFDRTVGRDKEKEEIFNLYKDKKDFIISGQPGSGKTHLLRELAKISESFFVIHEDLNNLSSDIRFRSPEYLLIDDAHSKLDLVNNLLNFRKVTGADFKIAVDTWPSGDEDLRSLMSLTNDEIISLPPLKRDTLVELITSTDIRYPNWVVRSIVDQSRGKPGLAAFLCTELLAGQENDVIFGGALYQKLKSTVDNEKFLFILSVISLSGDNGISLSKVCDFLEENFLNTLISLSQMKIAGVVEEKYDNKISIQPSILRSNLVKEHVLKHPELLQKISDEGVFEQESFCKELIQAVRVGGIITVNKLFFFIKGCITDSEVLNSFCWLGKEYVRFILEIDKNYIGQIAEQSLRYDSKETLIKLLDFYLENLTKDEKEKFKVVENWLTEDPRDSRFDISLRRNEFIETVEYWLKSDFSINKMEVAGLILPTIFTVNWDSHDQDPGLGRTINIVYGIMPMKVIKRIPLYWNKICDLYKLKYLKENALLECVNALSAHRGFPVQAADNVKKMIKQYKLNMLEDLVRFSDNISNNGFKCNLIQVLEHRSIQHTIELDKNFEILFGRDIINIDNYKEEERKTGELVNKLAEEWAEKDPKSIVPLLKEYVDSAREANISWPNRTYFLCDKIASIVTDPLEWAKEIFELQVGFRHLEPFLSKAINEDSIGWKNFFLHALDSSSENRIALITIAVKSNNVTDEIWSTIGKLFLDSDSKWVKDYFSFSQIPEINVERMLLHDNLNIRSSFAIAIWDRSLKVNPYDKYETEWKRAISKSKVIDRTLQEILKSNPDINYEWCKEQLNDKNIRYEALSALESCIYYLTNEKKIEIIRDFKFDTRLRKVLRRLISFDIKLFKALLNTENELNVKLLPLEVEPSNEWIKLAEVAMDHGVEVVDIYNATIIRSYSWSGKESDYWSGRIENCKRFLNTDDQRIVEVLNKLIEMLTNRKEMAIKRQEDEEINGY